MVNSYAKKIIKKKSFTNVQKLFNYFNPLNLMLHSNYGYNLCEFNNSKGQSFPYITNLSQSIKE